MLSFFVNSWMTIHLGINPDSGGRPPIDIMTVRTSIVVMGVLFQVCDRERRVVVELIMSSINIVSVIVKYINRYSIVIVGLYTKIAVIQPMWPIDE